MSDEQSTTSATEANALHAAEVWLQRIGAPSDAVAVVTLWPRAKVGVLLPGSTHVRVLPALDDQAVELCEAVAPLADQAARQLGRAGMSGVMLAVIAGNDAGVRVEALLSPLDQSGGFRLIQGQTCIFLGGFALESYD